MTRRAVTSAQIQRTVKAMEAMGKTVVGGVIHPDGSWEFRLTDASGATLPSPNQADAAWQGAMDKWRRSA